MTARLRTRFTLPGVAATILALAACDANPSGLPYRSVGRDMAGVYLSEAPASTLDLRIALGTRYAVSGRYTKSDGAFVSFSGSWERNGDRLIVTLTPQPGLPTEIVLDISREEILTEIEPGPFSLTPETAPPQYFRQRIVRLTGTTTVEGQSLHLDLVRVVSDVTSGGGGQTAN